MMVINEDQLQWFTSFLVKNLLRLINLEEVVITNEPNHQLTNELHKPIVRKLKKEKFIHLLETKFGVLI